MIKRIIEWFHGLFALIALGIMVGAISSAAVLVVTSIIGFINYFIGVI